METITGYVDHIVYRNGENGYTVFSLENENGEVTCVGNFNYINEGELLELEGEYVNHNIYGTQLRVSSHRVKEPEDLVSIERYLGSGAVKGVGAALAARIVRRFKEDTFRIIEEEPERLAEIKGISERKARDIAIQVEEKKEMRKAMLFLQKYGISTTLGVKIYEYYGAKLYQVLEENPYQLADNIDGVGFKTADEIAARIGIHADSDFRIRSGLFYVLQQAVGEGHIYLPQDVLARRAMQILEVEISEVEKYVMDLCIDRKTVMKEENGEIRIYPAHYYYLELNTAKMLHDLDIDCEMPEDMIEKRLKKVEEKEKITLDALQHQAVIEAIKHGLLVLTGGPGTGKTTTINTMIQFFESEGMDILLAAPTGRAAKRRRISERLHRPPAGRETCRQRQDLSGTPHLADEILPFAGLLFYRHRRRVAETIRTMAAGGTALFRQLHRHPFSFVAGTLQQRNHRRPNQENGLPFRHVQSEPIQGSHGQTVADKRGYSADYGLRGTDADQVPQTVPATGKRLVPVQLFIMRHQSDRHSAHPLCRHRGRAAGFQPTENG